MCCVSFSTYEEDILDGAGLDWISCACGQWLHEDCAEDRESDDEGKNFVSTLHCGNITCFIS